MFILNTLVIVEIIIISHELGHFFAAKIFNVGVKEFSIGFGPSICCFIKKETKYCVRAFFLGGFVSFKEDKKFLNIPIFKRMVIVLAGPFFNFLFGFLAILFVLVLQGKFNSTEVEHKAGYCTNIEIYDNIKKVNGKKILCANDLLYRLNRIPLNESINLTVERNKKDVEIYNVGKIIKTNEGEKRYLGISLKLKKVDFFNCLGEAFRNFIFFTRLIFSSIFNIFTGNISLKEFSGPVGLLRTVGNVEKEGISSLIFLFSFLSINIGAFNLLPFIILDGGQFLFLLFELVFRRRVKTSIRNILNLAGVLILFLLFVIISIKDIYMIFLH